MSNNELIHEVEESLRREKLAQTWKEYGPYIISGIIISILLTGFISGWRAWTHKVATRQTAMIVEALDNDNKAAALDSLIPSLSDGRRGVAFMTEAGLLIRDDKKQEALAVFDKAAADGSLPSIYRQLAALMSVRLASDMPGDGKTAEALLKMLTPLMDDKKSPWRWHAHLQAALIAAHKQGDFAQAQHYLDAVLTSGESLPPSLRERARALDHVYGIEAAARSGQTQNKGEPEG